jgi:hypothetical protein
VVTKRRVLVFGDTHFLRELAAALRSSPLLVVAECSLCDEHSIPEIFHPDVILVDGAQITPEQFQTLLVSVPSSRSTLIGVDPFTYQLTVLSSPCGARPLARVARIIEILTVSLSIPPDKVEIKH